jgi:hypothetical protein
MFFSPFISPSLEFPFYMTYYNPQHSSNEFINMHVKVIIFITKNRHWKDLSVHNKIMINILIIQCWNKINFHWTKTFLYKTLYLNWCAPKLLKRPKIGSHNEITKKKKVGACSLACSTLGVGHHARALGLEYDEFIIKNSIWNQPRWKYIKALHFECLGTHFSHLIFFQ